LSTNKANDAGPADPGCDLVAPELLEFRCDERGRPVNVVKEFRMRVKVAAPFDNLAVFDLFGLPIGHRLAMPSIPRKTECPLLGDFKRDSTVCNGSTPV
jgi:hypothetical protein